MPQAILGRMRGRSTLALLLTVDFADLEARGARHSNDTALKLPAGADSEVDRLAAAAME